MFWPKQIERGKNDSEEIRLQQLCFPTHTFIMLLGTPADLPEARTCPRNLFEYFSLCFSVEASGLSFRPSPEGRARRDSRPVSSSGNGGSSPRLPHSFGRQSLRSHNKCFILVFHLNCTPPSRWNKPFSHDLVK